MVPSIAEILAVAGHSSFAVPELPRTVSGKITELAVRDIIHGKPVKNASALANPGALEYFRDLKELSF